jgi:hypothetical protein
MKITNALFLLNVFYIFMVNSFPVDPLLYPNNCTRLSYKNDCNKKPGCGWCSDNGWDGIYRCIETIDDNDCIIGIVNDCIRSTRCYYCIFNIYATDYCFKSLYSPYKLYNL